MYLRIEDSYPFALGVLIPSITVETANQKWELNQKNENSELAFKVLRIEGFSIFMERDPEEAIIDKVLGVKKDTEINNDVLEGRIYSHIADVFSGVSGTKS